MLAWPVGGPWLAYCPISSGAGTSTASRLLGLPQMGWGAWVGAASVLPQLPFVTLRCPRLKLQMVGRGFQGRGLGDPLPTPSLSRADRRFQGGDCRKAWASLCVTGSLEMTRRPPQGVSAWICCALVSLFYASDCSIAMFEVQHGRTCLCGGLQASSWLWGEVYLGHPTLWPVRPKQQVVTSQEHRREGCHSHEITGAVPPLPVPRS